MTVVLIACINGQSCDVASRQYITPTDPSDLT